MVASVLLSFAVGFVLIRIKNKEQSDAPNKETAGDLNMRHSRSGNSMAIKFSPPKSVQDNSPAAKRTGSLLTTPEDSEKREMPMAICLNTQVVPKGPPIPKFTGWPITSSFDDHHSDNTANTFWPRIITSVPPKMSEQKSKSISDTRDARQLALEDAQDMASTVNSASPPGKAGHSNTVENSIIAGANSEPFTQQPLTFGPMHRISGDFGRQVVETLRERDVDEESWTTREPSAVSSCGLGAKELEQHVLAAEAFEDPFADPVVDLQESIVDRSCKNSVEQPSKQQEHASSRKTRTDHSHLEDTGDQAKTFWKRGKRSPPWEEL
jgi:hypothetical protein